MIGYWIHKAFCWCLTDEVSPGAGIYDFVFTRCFAWFPVALFIREPKDPETIESWRDFFAAIKELHDCIGITWLRTVYRAPLMRRGPLKYFAITPGMFVKLQFESGGKLNSVRS